MKITLATLPQATAQQVFDQVAVHLLTQGQRSLVDGKCVYRGSGGLKCAAGCLIGDEEYHPRWDEDGGASWHALIARKCAPTTHIGLIVDLQHLHDRTRPADWMSELITLAVNYHLSPAVVTNFKVQQ